MHITVKLDKWEVAQPAPHRIEFRAVRNYLGTMYLQKRWVEPGSKFGPRTLQIHALSALAREWANQYQLDLAEVQH